MDITLTPVGLRKALNRRKKHDPPDADLETIGFLTNFSSILKNDPPTELPCTAPSQAKLFRQTTAQAKAMVRICPVKVAVGDTWLSCDAEKRQITVCGDPSLASNQDTTTPKNFSFDAVFPQESSLAEVCATSLTDLLQAVVLGSNGCIYCYGHAGLGKTYTMLGIDDSRENLGVIPSALSWIYHLINEQVKMTASKFCVRVSAIEVTGKQGIVRDLLTNVSTEKESVENTGSTVFFHEDPVGGARIENQKELRAPTAQHAAFYLDAAIAARTVPDATEDSSNSHFRFTLHIYQYRIGRISRSHNKVIGGRSQLHFLDLGNCSNQGDGYSISTLGTVLFAALSGQRHVPQKESRLTQLIRESMNGPSCHTCMIAQVSPSIQSHSETLQVLQLASRIHRLKPRKKSKLSSTSSDDSSHEDFLTNGQMHSSFYSRATEGRSSSDPEYVSSSEQSCDTVIFVGKGRQTNGNRKINTSRTVLKVPENLNTSDDQKKLVEKSVVSVQGLSDSIVKSVKSKTEMAEIWDQSELGSQASLRKDSEVSSGSSCSDPSQRSVFESELCKGAAAQLRTSQKSIDVRHDPLGDECLKKFEESTVSNSRNYDKSATCMSNGSEHVRCRVRKRHHPLPSNLVKQNELWVDGPNAVTTLQVSKEDKNVSNGVKEVLLDSIKTDVVNSVQLAKNPVQVLKEEKSKVAAVGDAAEAAVVDNCNLEASIKKRNGLVTSSGGMVVRCAEDVTRQSEEGKEQEEGKKHDEGRQKGDPSVGQSSVMGFVIHTKVTGSSEEAAKRCRDVQQPSQAPASATNSGFISESSPASRQTDSANPGICQEENSSVLRKKLSKSPDAETHSAESNHHAIPRDSEVHGMLVTDSCDRTAQWVKNIEEASTSRFVQLLHSRKELLRSFRVRRNSHSMSKAPTMNFIESCQILATFDQPVDIPNLNCTVDNTSNSAFQSSIAGTKSTLDINENVARLQENNRENSRSQCSGIKSVMTTKYSGCLQRPNACVSSMVGIDCVREKGNRNMSDKNTLTECLRGSLLFCGRSSAALDKDEAFHDVEKTAKDVGRFDTSCSVRLSQPDGASNPNIMDELHEHFTSKEPHMLQNRNDLQSSPLDQRKITSDLLALQEKMGRAFHLDSKGRNTQEHSTFSTFYSSESLIHTKATFPFNLSTRQRSESVSCNMTVNDSSNIVPTISPHDSTIHIKSNSLQLTTCDDAVNLCAVKSSSDEVVTYSPTTDSCRFDMKKNSLHQTNKLSDRKTSLPCCCEIPTGLAVSETNSQTGARHKDCCMERSGSDDSTFTLRLFRSLQGRDLLSGLDVGKITDIQNEEEMMIAETNEDEDVTWLPNTCQKLTPAKQLHRIDVLLNSRDRLKEELANAKDILMVDGNCWSHDLHVAEQQMDSKDPSYLEALERETFILQKRVNACKSRIMVITVFDITS